MNIIPLAKIVTYFGIAKYLGWKMEMNKTQGYEDEGRDAWGIPYQPLGIIPCMTLFLSLPLR